MLPIVEPSSDAPPRGQFRGTVTLNELLCTDHYRLRLHVPHFPASTPGQFVQLDCGHETDHLPAPPHDILYTPGQRLTLQDPDMLNPNAYLRRPFSIARHRSTSDGAQIDIIHRVVGKGTRALQSLQPGDSLNLLGPLGKGFTLPPDVQTVLLVGGGVGIPPMFYLAEHLQQQAPHLAVLAFVGAQRRDLLALPADRPLASSDGSPIRHPGVFGDCGYRTSIATDDGSYGLKGFVTQALALHLDRLAPSARAAAIICCCGPTPMMAATARVGLAANVRCLVSLEQPMACGMGTCQSCVVRYQPPGATEWTYKLTCTDGPVFDATTIRW